MHIRFESNSIFKQITNFGSIRQIKLNPNVRFMQYVCYSVLVNVEKRCHNFVDYAPVETLLEKVCA